MADIGSTLREARMRARMDITDLETQTKIRAKYLRALENEEWELLPGPAYVKTFLRTYAAALGLDSRVLVEEYKLRFENLSDIEQQPIAPTRATTGRYARKPTAPPRGLVVGVVVVALLAALWALGTAGGEEGDRSAGQATAPQDANGGGEEQPEGGGDEEAEEEPEDASEEEPEEVRLRLEATGPVYVCLADDNGILVRGEELAAGDETDTFEARRFRMILGNNAVEMIINGERRDVPSSDDRILLALTQGQGRQPLPESSAPDCT
ncbi:MAG: helix-turn-helix domain-containing protein [Solirubrobacteraceae bacterium MAG38_C4-C5]|nr:helix-turn-helix domain-containing protein [Candidatus Siliceabacter maunaloa]